MAKQNLYDQLKKNAADSYATYLSRQGIDENAGLEKEKAARITQIVSDTDHGALAESLNASGLSHGGYEEYLRGIAAQSYNTAVKAAEEESAVAKGKNLGGYEKYLSEYDKLQAKISEAVVKHFSEGTSFSIDDAYNYAVGKGLSEEHAMYTAAASVRAASEAAVKRIIKFAEDNALSAKQTMRYAEKFGLEKRYMDNIYNAMITLSDEERQQFSSMSSEDYLSYIKKMNS